MFGGLKRFRAILNAMNAKIIWSELSAEEQRRVEITAARLWAGGGSALEGADPEILVRTRESIAEWSEFERWSIFGMAMEQEGIYPRLGNEGWNPIRNPFRLRIKQMDVDLGVQHFSKNYGINVTLDSE